MHASFQSNTQCLVTSYLDVVRKNERRGENGAMVADSPQASWGTAMSTALEQTYVPCAPRISLPHFPSRTLSEAAKQRVTRLLFQPLESLTPDLLSHTTNDILLFPDFLLPRLPLSLITNDYQRLP